MEIFNRRLLAGDHAGACGGMRELAGELAALGEFALNELIPKLETRLNRPSRGSAQQRLKELIEEGRCLASRASRVEPDQNAIWAFGEAWDEWRAACEEHIEFMDSEDS